MATEISPYSSCLLLLLPIFFTVLFTNSSQALESDRKVYIVYMGEPPRGGFSAETNHVGMLEQVLGSSESASQSLVYSYKKSFNGFAAKLSHDEMNKIKGMDGIVSVFPSKMNVLHTTRSWDFMGFSLKANKSLIESDVIVGMLDTGIWPESDSFSDKGLGPPPKKWNGTCQSSANFTCNNKIIGARYYNKGGVLSVRDFDSPRDSLGHGTHTASTVAGGLVERANFIGLGQGTARGAVPSARLAVYKVCWEGGCSEADILAAFDDAIADGVDILSVSLGSPFPSEYFSDSIAIGAFHAMKKGILTSNSAGNSGPRPSSVSNYSPWSLTVAASSIDRQFVTKVALGDGKIYEGASLNTFTLPKKQYPFVYGQDVPNKTAGYDGSASRFCGENSLDETLVKGKIVFCDQLSAGVGPLVAGAAGTIMSDNIYADYSFSYPLPAAFYTADVGANILKYLNSTKNATAYIPKTTVDKDLTAPVVVSFSSRGPNPITADILKPDLSAPGVDILAAWSPVAPFSIYSDDKRRTKYNIISGTSMSCPHASGAAAYIKSFHPSWSPAAIKSALMTTAQPMKQVTNTDHEFAYGSGHINPVQAIYPGLVYDAGEPDYIAMLCSVGYNRETLRLVTGENSTCPKTNSSVWDLNYPSMALNVPSGESFSASFKRTVTNVGLPNSTYQATVIIPVGLNVSVNPSALAFKTMGEKQSFVVELSGESTEINSVLSATLIWKDGVHQVRSPIIVHSSLQQ